MLQFKKDEMGTILAIDYNFINCKGCENEHYFLSIIDCKKDVEAFRIIYPYDVFEIFRIQSLKMTDNDKFVLEYSLNGCPLNKLHYFKFSIEYLNKLENVTYYNEKVNSEGYFYHLPTEKLILILFNILNNMVGGIKDNQLYVNIDSDEVKRLNKLNGVNKLEKDAQKIQNTFDTDKDANVTIGDKGMVKINKLGNYAIYKINTMRLSHPTILNGVIDSASFMAIDLLKFLTSTTLNNGVEYTTTYITDVINTIVNNVEFFKNIASARFEY